MKKYGTACRQCRVGKRKCNRPSGEACLPCVKRQLDCSTATKRRVNADLRPSTASREQTFDAGTTAQNGGQDDPLLDLDHHDVVETVELYIKYIQDKPHSIFHVPSLREDVRSDIIDRALLLGILAMSSRFSPVGKMRSRREAFADRAKQLLKAGLENISLASVQAWIVMGNYSDSEINSVSASLFYGIAMRSAQILRLSTSDPEHDVVLQETKSRVYWALYMIDRWSSAGLGTPRQMGERLPTQQLPLDEHDFHQLARGQLFWPTPTKPGLWAYMIELAELFGPIQDLNRSLAMSDSNEPTITSQVGDLAQSLEAWQEKLPSHVRLSAETLAFHHGRNQGRTLVALHLGYFHYATLLFFQFLDPSTSDLPYAEVYAERCREHASAYSDLLRTSYEYGDCEAVWPIVGHMTVVSSSVLIHTLLFGNEETLPAAKARLESNFKVLMKLKTWWPSIGKMTDRLFVFQSACLRSGGDHTHKVDRWMVKFLLEHAITLGDKTESDLLDNTSPRSLDSADPPELQRLTERGQFTRHALSGLRT